MLYTISWNRTKSWGAPGEYLLFLFKSFIPDKGFLHLSIYRYGNSTKLYKVRVGDYHSLVPEEYEEEYGVDKIVFHPRYHSHSNDYDLALVHLSPGAVRQTAGECVSFSRHVLPVCLPARKERLLKQASNCHITGWGDTGQLIVCACWVCDAIYLLRIYNEKKLIVAGNYRKWPFYVVTFSETIS